MGRHLEFVWHVEPETPENAQAGVGIDVSKAELRGGNEVGAQAALASRGEEVAMFVTKRGAEFVLQLSPPARGLGVVNDGLRFLSECRRPDNPEIEPDGIHRRPAAETRAAPAQTGTQIKPGGVWPVLDDDVAGVELFRREKLLAQFQAKLVGRRLKGRRGKPFGKAPEPSGHSRNR